MLQDIPDRFLSHCYEQAVKGHKGPYALNAYEVKAVWDHAISSGLAQLWFLQGMAGLLDGDPCDRCGGHGWEYINEEGIAILFSEVKADNSYRVAQCQCRKAG